MLTKNVDGITKPLFFYLFYTLYIVTSFITRFIASKAFGHRWINNQQTKASCFIYLSKKVFGHKGLFVKRNISSNKNACQRLHISPL